MSISSQSAPRDFYDLFDLTKAIQVIEGGSRRYMGTMSRPDRTGSAGAAKRPGRVLISRLNPFTMAHEIGHTTSLYHAPACRAGGVVAPTPPLVGLGRVNTLFSRGIPDS